jgi:hypothetical protein
MDGFTELLKGKKGKAFPLQAYGTQGILEGDRLLALRTGRLYPHRSIPLLIFKKVELSDATEKIPSDSTGDRSRDLPTSSAVP